LAPHRFRVPDADAGRRLDAVLADLPEVGTRALAERLVTAGDVLVDGVPLVATQHHIESTTLGRNPITACGTGTRTRDRHMHDGLSLTFTDAILRHAGEARNVTAAFRALSGTQQNNLIVFLQSL